MLSAPQCTWKREGHTRQSSETTFQHQPSPDNQRRTFDGQSHIVMDSQHCGRFTGPESAEMWCCWEAHCAKPEPAKVRSLLPEAVRSNGVCFGSCPSRPCSSSRSSSECALLYLLLRINLTLSPLQLIQQARRFDSRPHRVVTERCHCINSSIGAKTVQPAFQSLELAHLLLYSSSSAYPQRPKKSAYASNADTCIKSGSKIRYFGAQQLLGSKLPHINRMSYCRPLRNPFCQYGKR
jgi:hypothetical protein